MACSLIIERKAASLFDHVPSAHVYAEPRCFRFETDWSAILGYHASGCTIRVSRKTRVA